MSTSKKSITCIAKVATAVSFACCLLVAPALATEINVNTFEDSLSDGDGKCSLREAVIAANTNSSVPSDGDCPAGQDGDTAVDVINLPDGIYPLTQCLELNNLDLETQWSGDSAECDDLDIYDDVIIQGTSTAGTIIEIGGLLAPQVNFPGPYDSRIFDIHTYNYDFKDAADFCEVNLQESCEVSITFDANDLSLRYGHDYSGGAIRATSGLNVGSAGAIHGNIPAPVCGGIPSVTLRRVHAYENEAAHCGGAVEVGGNLTVIDSTIEDNSSGYCGGGGIDVFGARYQCDPALVLISGTSVIGNETYHGSGGGVSLYHTTTTINNGSHIDNNGAYYAGGGIANFHGDLTVSDSTVNGNHGVENPYCKRPTAAAPDDDDDDDEDDDDNDGECGGIFGPYEGGGIYNAFFDQNVVPTADDDDDDDDFVQNVVLVENSEVNNNEASVMGAGISNGHFIFGCLSESGDTLATACNVNPDVNAAEVVTDTEVGGIFTVKDSQVNGNAVTGDIFGDFNPETLAGLYLPMGGGIHHGPLAGIFNVEGSTVADNTALFGGGIMNRWIMNISTSTIASNVATFPEEFFYIDGARVPGVSEDDEEHLLSLFLAGGGGVFNAAALDMTNSTVSSNETIGSGAGVFNITGPIYYLIWAAVNGHLNDLDEEEKEYPVIPEPGAILKNVTVTNNKILEPEVPEQELQAAEGLDGIALVGNGGGVATFTGNVTLRNTIVAGNEDELENFNLYFDEFDANLAASADVSGSPSASPTETSTSTATPTESPSASPSASPTPEFENPFVSQPDFAPDCYAFPDILGQLCYYLVTPSDILDVCEGLVPTISSERYNIIGDNTGCFPFQPAEEFVFDKVGTEDSPIDVVLGPLADNGGGTDTHLLLLGSPAIDMGNPTGAFSTSAEDEDFACEDSDQRGVVRPIDGDLDGEARCDVGAVEVEVDCNGDPTGSAVLDECGVCDGDGTSCREVACEEVDITQTQFSMDGTSDRQAKLVKSLARKLRKLTGKKKAAKKLVNSAGDLYAANWTSAWSIPSILQTDCQGGVACVQADNSGALSEFNTNSEELHKIAKRLIRKLKRAGLSSRKIKKLTKKNAALLATAVEESGKVPASYDQCSA